MLAGLVPSHYMRVIESRRPIHAILAVITGLTSGLFELTSQVLLGILASFAFVIFGGIFLG